MKKLQLICSIIILFSIVHFNLLAQCTVDNSCAGPYGNVVICEVSGDSGQSDGCEDGIVEICGPPGAMIGCMVVTDTEWAVLIPPGTVIPADGVFMIGCSASLNENCGVGNPGQSGLIGGTTTHCEGGGTEGDFTAGLLPEIDFDTCDPANAGFYDPAATGFTLDNPGGDGDGDGEQVFLFLPDGTPWDGIVWDGGGTGGPDHASVSLYGVPYTLGDNDGNGIVNDNAGTVGGGRGDGGNATAVPVLPTDAGCPCNTPNAPGTYTVPPITDPIWYSTGTEDFAGCNSSFIRGPLAGNGDSGNPSHTDGLITSTTTDASGQPLDNGGGLAAGTTGDAFTPGAYTPSSCGDSSAEWGYTDHPTPGQPNNDPHFVFYASQTAVCDATTPIDFCVETYNWQNVSDGSIDFALGASSGCDNVNTGSLVFFNGNVQGYDSYVVSGEQTTMCVQLMGWMPGNNTVTLVWDEWSNTNGTTGNPATQSNPNECYERFQFNILYAEPLECDCDGDGVADVPQAPCTISCDPGPPVPGAITASDYFIGGSGDFTFTLSDNAGTQPDDVNTTGIFLLPTSSTAGGYTLTVVDNSDCGFPNKIINIDDNCEEVPVCPKDFELTIDGGLGPINSCPGDVVELCFTGTDLPLGGAITFQVDDGSGFADLCVEPTPPPPPCPSGGEIYIASSDGTGDGSCTTSGEYVEICNSACPCSGTTIDISGWEIEDSASNDGSPATTVNITSGSLQAGECVIIYSGYLDGTIAGNATGTMGSSIAITADRGSCPVWNSGGDVIFLYDGDSQGAGTLIDQESSNGGVSTYQNPGPDCSSAGGSVPEACCEFTIPDDACPLGNYNFQVIVAPFDADNCPDDMTVDELDDTSDPVTANVSCPVADLNPAALIVCEADMNSVVVPVTISGGSGTTYTLEYSTDGGATTTILTGIGTTTGITIMGPTNGEIKVSLIAVTDEGGAMCAGAVDTDEACVNISPTLDLTISASSSPTTCQPCDGTVTFDLSSGTSVNAFDIDYTIDGVLFSVSSVSMPYTLTGACPGTYEIVGAMDDSGCLMTVTPNEQILSAPAGMPVTASTLAPVCGDGSVIVDLTTDITYSPGYSGTDFTFFTVDPNTLPAAALGATPPLLTSTMIIADATISPQDVYVQYTDPTNGCASVALVTIDASAPCCADVNPSFTCQDIPLCGGDFDLGAIDINGNTTDGTWGGSAASLVNTQGTPDISDDVFVATAGLVNIPLTLTLTMTGGTDDCPDVVFSCDLIITTDCDADAGKF